MQWEADCRFDFGESLSLWLFEPYVINSALSCRMWQLHYVSVAPLPPEQWKQTTTLLSMATQCGSRISQTEGANPEVLVPNQSWGRQPIIFDLVRNLKKTCTDVTSSREQWKQTTNQRCIATISNSQNPITPSGPIMAYLCTELITFSQIGPINLSNFCSIFCLRDFVIHGWTFFFYRLQMKFGAR